MAKYLKEVLKGVKSSTKVTNDLGGYKPKAGDEEDFAKKHEIEKHADRVGNGDDVYKGTTKHVLANTKEKNHGYKKPEDAKVNEEQIEELSTDLLHRAAHKAAKKAMTDVQGRSGPIFKKRAAQANKFRDKGMEQEKKEKAMKEEVDLDWKKDSAAVRASKDPKFINKMIDKWGHRGGAFLNHPALWPEIKKKPADKEKAVKEETIDEASMKQKQHTNRVKTMPGKKGAVMSATSNFEAPFHKVHATISKSGGSKEVVKHEIKAKDKHDAIFNVQMMHHKAGHKVHDTKYKGTVKEEAEQIDELSKKTLGNYAHAGVRDIASRQYALGKGDKSNTGKLMNRRKGVDKAISKLSKEEVEQVDELSKTTLGNYIKSASADVGHKKADAAYSNMSGNDKLAN